MGPWSDGENFLKLGGDFPMFDFFPGSLGSGLLLRPFFAHWPLWAVNAELGQQLQGWSE